MNLHRNIAPLGVIAFLAILSCGGCKSGTQQPGAQSSGGSVGGQPESAQPAPSPGAQPGQPSAAPSQAAAAPQAPPPPAVVDLPEGTQLRVRLDEDLGSKISHSGDSFTATLADDVTVHGQTVIAKGAQAEGTVIDAKPLGHFKGGALLELRLERVQSKWGSYAVATSSIARAEKGKGKRTAVLTGGGAGLGALIGGLAGGGKGVLIGGLAGAGAGTAGSAFTGNHEIVLPAETLLSFSLEHSVHITEQQ